MARELKSIVASELEKRLGDNPPDRDIWLIKCKRLRELVSNLAPNQVISTSVPEGHSNLLLVNIQIKTHAMLQLLRGTLVDFDGNAELQQEFAKFLQDNEIVLREAILQRLVVGLGAVCVVGDSITGWRLQSISPHDLWWDTQRGNVIQPEWIAREYRDTQGVRYRELWEREKRYIQRVGDTDVRVEPNPIGEIPIVLFPAFYIPDTVYPVGDVELAYPQQAILDEVRRAILNMARRGAGFYSVKRGSIDETELVRLTNPDEVYVLVNEQDAIVPVNTPLPNSEWQALETLAKQDMDALMGVSEYIRGVLPTGRAKFATEVVASVAGQTVRIQTEWYNTKLAIERLARVYYKIKYGNQFGDIVPRVVEDDVSGMLQTDMLQREMGWQVSAGMPRG